MNRIKIPGLVDMHVHFREPGYEYKETIETGTRAALAGGVTACLCMPNTSPVTDTPEIVKQILGKAAHTGVNILASGAVTIGQKGKELTDFAALKKAGAIAVTDDGMPVKDDDIMRRALIEAGKNGLLLISHCEPETEMAGRDTRLAAETGTRVHIAHVSCAETVGVIRRAKAEGTKVTAETCPHYFSLTEDAVKTHGANACMNPPLGTEKDAQAIIEGLRDGTIDVISTDHAPHSAEEKNLPAGKAPNGIIGLETSLAVTLTYLYHTGILTLEEIIDKMSRNPAKILGIGNKKTIEIDIDEEWTVDPSTFKSKSRNTPFAGMKLRGRVKGVL